MRQRLAAREHLRAATQDQVEEGHCRVQMLSGQGANDARHTHFILGWIQYTTYLLRRPTGVLVYRSRRSPLFYLKVFTTLHLYFTINRTSEKD